MINYGKHFIDKIDIASVVKVLKNHKLTQGKYVETFEQNLSKKFGAKYCTVLSNGTAALYLAIKSLNIKKGLEAVTTPITFSATASSVLMNNLNLNLVDIESDHYTLDLNKLEDKIKKNKKIKLILGMDYGGHPCDWPSLNYIKKKYNLFLINDNCHAMGSKINGSNKYACKYADIVTQSFHPVKNFTTGEGGAILTNLNEIYKSNQSNRSHGMIKSNYLNKTNGRWFYKIKNYGYNYRLTDFQSALGISQLKKLEKFVQKRRKIAKIYNENFSGFENFKLPSQKKKYFNSFHLYPLLIDFKKFGISKKYFFNKLYKENINLQVHYIPLYKHNYLKKFHFNRIDFPISERFYSQEVSLPIFYQLDLKKQLNIINKIKSFFK